MTAYQDMPDLSPDEFAQLKADIAERGVLVPVEYDEHGNVLDGHHRLKACAEMGITAWPRLVRIGWTEDQKRAHARALNLARRHLTQEQRRALIREQLKDTPTTSDRQIARALGVDHKTVSAQRDVLVDGGEIPHHDTVIGSDGVEQPRYKAAPRDEAEGQGGLRHVSTFIDAAGLEHLRQLQPDFPEPDAAPLPHNHRAQGTGENEWYTPAEHLEAAREVLGGFDLDPASSPLANEAVGAARFFTLEDNGLEQPWTGRVWLNPPYSQPAIAQFAEKLASEWEAGNVNAAIALTHNYTDTAWFHRLAASCKAICFTRGRIGFINPEGKKAAPTQGQAFFYFGVDASRFAERFRSVGFVVTSCSGKAA